MKACIVRVLIFPHVQSSSQTQNSQTNFVDHLCCFKLRISVPSLRICTSGDRSHLYRKDRWRLYLIFVVIQVERETVMTAWRLHWGHQRVRPIFCHMLSSIIIRMFNLSTLSICVVIMHKFCGSCMFLLRSIMCCHLRFRL